MALSNDGWDVFLPFRLLSATAETLQGVGADGGWERFFDFVAENKLVRAWPCQDIHGNDLDPNDPDDYHSLDVSDISRLATILASKAGGGADSGE